MYKGVEALTAECLLACEKAGVTDEVLSSLGNDWATGADYRLDRMLVVHEPDQDGRRDIILHYLSQKQHDPDIPLETHLSRLLADGETVGWHWADPPTGLRARCS